MHKSLVVLAILGTMSVPVVAQTSALAASQAQPAKPQTVKKRVCEIVDEDSYSRLGNRKICKTIEVPADGATGQQTPPPANATGNNL